MKYGNKKTIYDGIVFDSKKEANRWAELKLMERAGTISYLKRQVKYVLIPAQRDAFGKLVERELSYVADFVYDDNASGLVVVEDVKGYRDTSSAGYAKFVIKRKLMLWIYGIRIKEV